MTIAITGATGFVGRRLAQYHLKCGDNVRYLTRTNNRAIYNALPFIGDINSSANVLSPFLHNVDVLYHCAAELNNEDLMFKTNVDGTINLLSSAIGNVKKIVQLSSTGVYGDSDDIIVTEDTLPKPNNPYEISKLEADNIAIEMAKEYDLNMVIIRPSNIYGATMTNQSLFGLIKAINARIFFFIGKKGAIVNYIHVDNVVYAMVLAASSENKHNASIYNISDYCSIEDFVGFIADAIGKKTPKLRLPHSLVRMLATLAEQFKKSPLTNARVDALTRRTIYSSAKISYELGYQHPVSIEQGINELAYHWVEVK